MTIASRIKKIRDLSGLRQSEVAGLLNISQQAYCGLEQSADNAKLETLRRFCRVMKVNLSYLISDTLPVTEETLNKYGGRDYADIIAEYEKTTQRLEVIGGIKNPMIQFTTVG